MKNLKDLRILLLGFDTPFTYPVVQKLKSKYSPEYIHHIYDPEHFPGEFPHVNLGSSFSESPIGNYIGGPGSEILTNLGALTPIDQELLKALAPFEVLALKMADRMNPDVFGEYGARKAFYLNQIRYWSHFLKSKKINLCLMHNIPHHPVRYAIYALAKYFNIPILYYEKIPISVRMYAVHDYEESGLEFGIRYRQLRDQFDRNCHLTGEGRESASALDKEFEEHFNNQVAGQQKYFHIEHFKKNVFARPNRLKIYSTRLSKLARQPCEGIKYFRRQYWTQRRTRLKQQKCSQVSSDFYSSKVVKPDLSKPFVFVPLHLQPEATTSPQGDIFVDQELMIHILSKSIPNDWIIYVKENPFQDLEGRNIDFYKSILSTGRVQFISKAESPGPLIKTAQAVATITGTAGWEALFQRTPVLVFGYCYYMHAPGVYRVSSVRHCQDAVRNIVRGKRIANEDLRLFLLAIQDLSFQGFVEPRYAETATFSAEENSQNILNNIEAWISRCYPNAIA